MLNAIQCCFSLTADPATWKNPRHLAKGCLYPLAFSPYTWSACLCTLIADISCHIIVDYTFPFTLQLLWWLFCCLVIWLIFRFLTFLHSNEMIFAFLLCCCCFIELPALLIPKSFKKKPKKNQLSHSTFLNFSLSEKNVLKDYLIIGKPCVFQKARFLVDSSCGADCCVREHRGN